MTDITKFKCLDNQKLYLDPIYDLFNEEVISYGISNRPSLDIVLRALEEAIQIIKKNATVVLTTIHSDQGWHYQYEKWTQRLKQNKIFQSMSRKETSSNNTSMENFFGIMKQEMYYGEPLVSYEELKKEIEEYIEWYNTIRGKEKLAA